MWWVEGTRVCEDLKSQKVVGWRRTRVAEGGLPGNPDKHRKSVRAQRLPGKSPLWFSRKSSVPAKALLHE